MGADTTARDTGYEPWARGAIKRGEGLTHDQGAELIDSLDWSRAEVIRLRARVAELEQIEKRARSLLGAADAAGDSQRVAVALRHVLGEVSR